MVGHPRLLTVETSLDTVNWTQAFRDSTAGLTIRGLIEEPRDAWVTVPVRTEEARFIRLRLENSDDSVPWLISELEILGAPRWNGPARNADQHEAGKDLLH